MVVKRFFTQKSAQEHADGLLVSSRASRSSGGKRVDYIVRKVETRRWKPYEVRTQESRR